MASYDVLPSYCALLTACYLINRSPTANSIVTPYESVYDKKPSTHHLVPFYAIGIYHRTKEERVMDGTWGYKAEPCRMLVDNTNCNDAYIILVIRSGNVIPRDNCVFDISEIHRSISKELSYKYNENSNIEADDNKIVVIIILMYFNYNVKWIIIQVQSPVLMNSMMRKNILIGIKLLSGPNTAIAI